MAGALLSVNAAVCAKKKSCTQFELASLNKKKKERKTFWSLGDLPVWYFYKVFIAPLGVLFIMKTLEDERYIVIKYKFSIFEIESLFCHILCVRAIPAY